MADTFVITGTRPPSVAGLRPMTASSRDFGYFTKKSQSSVDETLFRSNHQSALHDPVTFAAPWNSKPKSLKDGARKKSRPARPLLWAPPTSSNHFTANDPNNNPNNNSNNNNNNHHSNRNNVSFSTKLSMDNDEDNNSSRSFGTIHGVPMRHQYQRLKHTPTFVDETLFGGPLQEPTFKAPWEEKRKVRQTYNWDQEERRPVRRRRPATALGLRGVAVSAEAVPVWKP